MDIQFKTSVLAKSCSSKAEMVRKWGERRAKILGRRLDDLRAADTLDDIRGLPGDCHEYKKKSGNVLTVDLDGGWRLFFSPCNDPIPRLADGKSLDWTKTTAIEITGVTDPHE